MIALDTNVLVQFLTRENEEQHKKVEALLKKPAGRDSYFFASDLVILETIWVLKTSFNCTRLEILDAIESLFLMRVIGFESEDRMRVFLDKGRDSAFDLPDLLIGLKAKDSGCEKTLTFDKNAAKSDLFALL